MNFPVFSSSEGKPSASPSTYLFIGAPLRSVGNWPSVLSSWLELFVGSNSKPGLYSFQHPDFKAVLIVPETTNLEAFRRQVASVKVDKTILVFSAVSSQMALAGLESMALGSYAFKRTESLNFYFPEANEQELNALSIVVDSVYQVRDWVNMPHNQLNSTVLHAEIQRIASLYGMKYEGLGPKAIEALKMAGLESVNKGSDNPPLFAILEYCPMGKEQDQPIVLVGKGVTFDTGGHSLKTAKGMEEMKGDMAGAATVLGVMMGLARNKYPQKVVALLPVTDNRLAPSSLSPGDVVAYSNGLTVEVLNTDAEGRLILADALLYASKLNPAYVMDLATLTGSAHAAVGEGAMVAFESDATQVFEKLKAAGESVGEHIVQFPLLPEYDEQLKSTVADLKNIGGGLAGAITAALFLKRFTSFPWIHIDLSMALASAPCYYRTAGGTGSGVRLLLEFFDKASNLPISKP